MQHLRSNRLLLCFSPDWVVMFVQVAARTETGVRRRTQAVSRSCSKRKSRFSSLWGLDTTSKKKTKAHPSINQVCKGFITSNNKIFFPPALILEFSDHLTLFFLSLQVFAGEEPVKKPADGIYVDPTKEQTVRRNRSYSA